MQTEGSLLYEQPKVSYTSFQPERTGQQLCEPELGEMMPKQRPPVAESIVESQAYYVRLLSSLFHECTL